MASSPGPGLTLIDGKDIILKEKLGHGGFGEVYKAKHVNWGDVAVKRLKGVTLTADIQKEADRMLRVVSSPYLVTIMGLIKNPGDVGIIMEYFEYGSLKEFETNYMKCACWARKVKMVQDIALGMNYLHTLDPPIIHRDLKLDNMFVGGGFEAKIGDLGLAVSNMTSHRQANAAGTGSHIPPEATSDTEIDPDEFWDIYTFAITLYELVSGRDAWPQQKQFANDALIAAWVYKGHRPDLTVIPPEAPKELVDLIQKCWVGEPKQRPTFKDILACVTELFDNKYKQGLRKADRALLEQIDQQEEDESRRQQEGTSEADSGLGSDFWGAFEAMSVEGQDDTTKATTEVKDQDTTAEETPEVKSKDTTVETATDVEGQDTTMNATEFKGQDTATEAPTDVKGQDTITDTPADVKDQDTTAKATTEVKGQDTTEEARTDVTAEDTSMKAAEDVKDQDASQKTAAMVTEGASSDAGTASVSAIESKIACQYKLHIHHWFDSCHMISQDYLAFCMQGRVDVYRVTAEKSEKAYEVSVKEWKSKEIHGVAVSASLPDSMLVVCAFKAYVYQCPCRQTTTATKKYKIENKQSKNPWCIVANDDTAVIRMTYQRSFSVYKLPGFTLHSQAYLDFHPDGFCISSQYLLVIGNEAGMVVKPLTDLKRDICRIKSPDGWKFISICSNKSGREIYAASQQGDKSGCVYKYTWNGEDTTQDVNPECIVDGLGGKLAFRCLSVTSSGILAIGCKFAVNICKLK